ncbi:hypothetical protein [Lentibacillus cibarius]|uniref:Uncharacterized protein n=1 Tax=Lentibacillus cibarius TaxID=2583219 RepID=A0A5S3QKB4_9BACI|nr:hypothetical protein [Lentibacillus cibarius]TMN22167.1 hypothetical protein FFL34_08530 [Lentibacillus cibarius]
MRTFWPVTLGIIVFLMLAACHDGSKNMITNTYDNPTPADFLEKEDADIFYFDGLVYSNAEDIPWVEELEYTLGEAFGEITYKTDKAIRFKGGVASKLSAGTKIYTTDTPVYIAMVDGREIPYLEMVEG